MDIQTFQLGEKTMILTQSHELRATHVFIDFHVIIRKLHWGSALQDSCMMMVSQIEDETVKFSFGLKCNSKNLYSHDQDYFIMIVGIAVDKKYSGRKLYYKYVLISDSSSYPPHEMLSKSSSPTELKANNCFRVIDIIDNDIIRYDSCIHPQVPDNSYKAGLIAWFSKDQSIRLKQIDRTNELAYCINTYLSEEFSRLKSSKWDSEEQVCEAYKKIEKIFESFSNAKIIKSTKKIIDIFDDKRNELRHCLIEIIIKLQSVDDTKKILSGLILLRFFAFSNSFLDSNNIKCLLSVFEVRYDSSGECIEYNLIKSMLPNNK
jgi:hypothetical protein